jgi:hypothetical protein
VSGDGWPTGPAPFGYATMSVLRGKTGLAVFPPRLALLGKGRRRADGMPVASGRLKVVEPDSDDWPCPLRLYNSNRASASCYGVRQCKADQVGEDLGLSKCG